VSQSTLLEVPGTRLQLPVDFGDLDSGERLLFPNISVTVWHKYSEFVILETLL
jgi:hypothetical protein